MNFKKKVKYDLAEHSIFLFFICISIISMIYIASANNPSIFFVSPTPSDGVDVNENYICVNVTVNDSDHLTSFIDWNYSLVGWWRFESINSTNYISDSSKYGNDGKNMPAYCYQETANVGTVCGGVNTGTYTFILTGMLEYGDMYINYTKPVNSLNISLWQVKTGLDHSTGTTTENISMPLDCWNSNPNLISLRIRSGIQSPNIIGTSCYNGSSWITIGNNNYINYGSNWNAGASSIGNLNDGDWSTGAGAYVNIWAADNTWKSGIIFEEAMYWGNISSNAAQLTSGKFGNALKFDGVNDYVSVADSTSLDITDAITFEAWMNYRGQAGSGEYLIAGESDGVFNGYSWTGSAWQSDSGIVSGLGDVGAYSSPTVFQKDATWYLITGNWHPLLGSKFLGYNWTGSAWQSDSAIVNGLVSGVMPTPTVFQKDATWYLIAGNNDGTFDGSNWTGSAWQSDSGIVSGLGDVGSKSAPTVFQKDATWYLIAGNSNGVFRGYNWTGSAWQSDSAMISGLGDIGDGAAPTVFQKDATWYLISGAHGGVFLGYNWTGSAWQSDSGLVSGLGDVGFYSTPAVFNMGGGVTDAAISKGNAYAIKTNTTHAFARINDKIITAPISSGWNHIALTYNSTAGGTEEMKLYVNGVKSATADYSIAINTNADDFVIGDLFNGTIDEVKIWKRALMPEEIKASYNTTLYGLEANFTDLAEETYIYTAYVQNASGNINQTETRTAVRINAATLINYISNCSNLTQEYATYYLTADIINSTIDHCMNISANNVILDCQGHTIDGTNVASFGISSYKTTNTTIRNCTLSEWSGAGIYLYYYSNKSNIINVTSNNNDGRGIIVHTSSNNNNLINITTNNNQIGGIFIYGSHRNNLTSIEANNNEVNGGIHFWDSSGNTLTNSIFQENADNDLSFHVSSDSYCNNKIGNIIGSNNLPIKYYNDSVSLSNEELSELILCNADNSNITNVTINASQSEKNNGLYVLKTEDSNFKNIVSSDNYIGLDCRYSNKNNITNITAKFNDYGIYLHGNADLNIILNSTISTNSIAGLYLSKDGLDDPEYNQIYNNLFNNTVNVKIDNGIIGENYFNATRDFGTRIYTVGNEIGGNYWTNSTGDGYSNTCVDSNNDNFCDQSHDMSFGTSIAYDYLALVNLSFFPFDVTIISPVSIDYMDSNIDIIVSTNKNTTSCKYSLNGGTYQNMITTIPVDYRWESSVNVPEIKMHEITVNCTDIDNISAIKSVFFYRKAPENLIAFDKTPITMKLSEYKRVNIFIKNQYDYVVSFNINITHDTTGLFLTNFGWFDGHRSDINRTYLNVQLSPGASETISYIQYGGLVGMGDLILNVKMDGITIIDNAKKQVTIQTSQKRSFFAATPDVNTTGFLIVALISSIMLFLRKRI